MFIFGTAGKSMLSYSRGPDTPLIEQSTWEIFEQTASRYPAKDALIVPHQQTRLTYSNLRDAVERTAKGLVGLGIGRCDRIGIWSTNCVEWILIHLAATRLGAVLVNVNPAYRAYELRFVLRKSGMKALFLWESDQRSNYAEILKEARDGQDLALQHVIYICGESWTNMFLNGVDAPELRVDCNDVTNIQYTSGTTGSPKGVLLTHRNLLNNGVVIASGMNFSAADLICAPVPLYHCFGCVGGTMAAIVTGAGLLLPAPTFDPLATMKAIQEFRATAIYGVPTMFIAQLDHPEFSKFDFSSLRTGVMAGAPCPVEVMKRVVNDMHCPEMTIMYGQTESSPVITMSSGVDDIEKRVGTVGRACQNTEAKVVDVVTGETVAAGEKGELCTRGYLVMKGYDQDSQATAKSIDEEGWLHTGDLAVMRTDEYFHITGRAKDMIIRGGENIYPREVEEFLYQHPAISDAQVFGVPDKRLGENVGAWIRLRPGHQVTEDDIREFCRGRIAHFKIPHYIRFVTEFPMTVTGKIQKFKMRELEIRELNLESAASVKTA
jgi:fatty-acyl-CoA synthase